MFRDILTVLAIIGLLWIILTALTPDIKDEQSFFEITSGPTNEVVDFDP